MILGGDRYINKHLQLKPGDKFQVHITAATPNSTYEMEDMNGQWLTVEYRIAGNQNYYESYAHRAEGNRYAWFWFHMGAIERANSNPLVPIGHSRTLLPPI